MAFVGLLETLLTAKLVDDLTDTRSHKGKGIPGARCRQHRRRFLHGGIGGCAMIAQTVVNVKIGQGRTRFRRRWPRIGAAGAGDGSSAS